MKVVKCASCGAPLDEVSEDTAVRCQFCGAINEPTVMRPAPAGVPEVRIVLDAQGVRRSARRVGGGIAVFTLLMVLAGVLPGIWGLWVGLRAAFPDRVPRVPGERVWTMDNLSELREGGRRPGRRPIETAPPASGYARFDPVAQLPWALAIAQAWTKDARLDRIDASRIRPDGTVDAAGDPDAEVLYRFHSPSRVAEYWKQADLRADARAEGELWVIAQRGLTMAQLITSRPSKDAPPPHPRVLSLAHTLERSRGRLPQRPFYKGYMVHTGSDGWVWYLSTLSGRESLPRVRATDGRVWPWTGSAPASVPPRRSRETPKGYTLPGR